MESIRPKWNIALLLFCVLALLLSGWAPTAAAKKAEQIRIVYFGSKTISYNLCVGEIYKDVFWLAMDSQGEYIEGGAISVNGSVVSYTDDAAIARIRYKVEKAGPFTLNIVASKSGYTNSKPLILKGKAQECGWRIRFFYEETVHTTGGKFFEATCYMKFDNQTFVRDDQDNLVLTTGTSMIPGKYGCYTGGLEYPLKVSMTPDIDETMDIQFSGRYVNDALQITLSAVGGTLPKQVQVKIEDAVRGGSGGTVTWQMQPKADVINQAKVNKWTTNTIFDYKIFAAKKSLFFSESGLKLSSQGTVIVELDKQHK